MNAISILSLAIGLLKGVSQSFNLAGLATLADGIDAAVIKLQEVHGSAVTHDQVKSLEITPLW